MKRMKTMRKEEKISPSSKDLEKKFAMLDAFLTDAYAYIRSLGFDKRIKRGEIIPAAEVKQLFRENVERYFRGEVDQKFIIGLAHIFDSLAVGLEGNIEGPEVTQILAVSCPLIEIESEIMKYGKIKKSPEEIDKIIHQLFEEYLQ
jgi:hypothetical protein